jgi:hypothetical protein
MRASSSNHSSTRAAWGCSAATPWIRVGKLF